MKRLVVLGLVVGGLWTAFGRHSPPKVVDMPPLPAVSASALSEHDAPLQRDLREPHRLQINGYELKTLAQFALKARALSTEAYTAGREADLSPVDAAFGWGRMSDPAVIERLTISQSNRWYHWRYEGDAPIPPPEIVVSSANMHLIPADAAVARTLRTIRKGQIVRLGGYLVEVRAKDGWMWRSSLSRDDTGQGSCEVILVQTAEVG